MATYKEPRRFNWVSVPVYALLLGGLYALIQFAPHYYRNLKVDEVVRAAVNEYWAATRGTTSGDAPGDLRDRIERQIRSLGVDDPQLQLSFERDPTDLRVTARYRVIVKHWGVDRTTTLSFAPTASTPIVDRRL
jgi:hypothetical protein